MINDLKEKARQSNTALNMGEICQKHLKICITSLVFREIYLQIKILNFTFSSWQKYKVWTIQSSGKGARR